MRILVLFAHPVETSFAAALHRATVAALRAGGHEVDDCDLYAERFDPVLSREERMVYDDPSINRRGVAGYVDRLLAADALVLNFPVWNMGFPAILKGFVDRVFLPGVSFNRDARGDIVPALANIGRLGVVCTYGGSRLLTTLMGDPPRRYLMRTMRAAFAPGGRCDYLACYDMDHAGLEQRDRFLAKVERCFSAW